MDPYTSNSYDHSDDDSQHIPYIPYGASFESSNQQFDIDINENTNAASQSAAPSLESSPVYGQYNPYSRIPNVPPQQEPYLSGSSLPIEVNYPRKKRRVWLFVSLAVALFFLLAIAAYGITAYLNYSTPKQTLDTFCSALQSGDYQKAYDQFTPTMQTNFSESQFASVLSNDSVARCTHGSVNSSGVTSMTDLHLYHKSNLINNDTVTVSKGNDGHWKISNIQSA